MSHLFSISFSSSPLGSNAELLPCIRALDPTKMIKPSQKTILTYKPQTTSANTKTEAGAPGATGTSPGQDIGTDKVQDKSNTYKEPKHSHDHADKSSKSEPHHKSHKEKHSKNDSKDLLDASSQTTASTPTPSGAPGATRASPMEPFGGDESRDESPKVHDHHKHHDHSKKDETHSSEERPSSNIKPAANSKSSGDGETNPGVSASAKTPAGSGGPTGTGPMEPIGSDESRNDSPKIHGHHKHDSHHSAKTEDTPITKIKAIQDGTDSSKQSSKDESDGTPITKSKAISDGKDTTSTSSTKYSSSSQDTSSTIKKSDGEFDGPNASFSSEIGSKEDPGRVAEEKMYEQNAQHGDVGSMGVKQDSITGGGQFDVLKSEEAV
jgi:hypothetical protein